MLQSQSWQDLTKMDAQLTTTAHQKLTNNNFKTSKNPLFSFLSLKNNFVYFFYSSAPDQSMIFVNIVK